MDSETLANGSEHLAIAPQDMERADAVRSELHAPNEDYQTHTLLAVQVVLLQDIRFALNELLAYKQAETHR